MSDIRGGPYTICFVSSTRGPHTHIVPSWQFGQRLESQYTLVNDNCRTVLVRVAMNSFSNHRLFEYAYKPSWRVDEAVKQILEVISHGGDPT